MFHLRCLALMILFFGFSYGLLPAAEPESDGWITMLNGKDLTGWQVNPENPDSFHVEDGVLVVDWLVFATR